MKRTHAQAVEDTTTIAVRRTEHGPDVMLMSREAVDRAATLKNMLEDSGSDYLIVSAAGGTDEGVRLVAAICEAGDGSTYPTDGIETGALVEGIVAANFMDAGGAFQCLASALFVHMVGHHTLEHKQRAMLTAVQTSIYVLDV